VGDDIEVIVLEIEDNRVKLGFDVPRYAPICRGEIHRELSDAVASVEDEFS